MRLILMGTNAWVIPIFERAANEHEIIAVFTRGPKPIGRKKIITPSPVHEWAAARGITVHNKVKGFADLGLPPVDYIAVASYGMILKDDVLNFAPCLNIHPSKLPAYRGPAPMSTAVYNGDKESEICLMQVAAEVDAGDVYMRRPFAIGENDTMRDVESRVGEIASEMLSEFLAAPEKYPAIAQVGEPTFTRKWTSDDEWIDWSHLRQGSGGQARGARAVHNQVRSIGGRTKINGIDVKILETRIANGELEILHVQPAGKNPMDWRSFVNGQRGKIELGK